MTTPAQPDRDRDRDRDAGLPGKPGDRPGDKPGAHPDQSLPEPEKPKPTQLPADKPEDAKAK
jgi:hypothetical protein